MNNTLFVVKNFSSKDNIACIMKPDGNKHSPFSITNNHPSAGTLTDRIVAVLKQLMLLRGVIGMESTSICGDNLTYFLRDTGKLSGFERELHMLNPKQVKIFKTSYPDLPENNPADAIVIADRLQSDGS